MTTESAAAFYAVAVQILPVLFVVLSVEFDGSGYLPDALTEVDREYEGQHVTSVSVSSRSRGRRVKELALESMYTTYIILALVVGEVVGLVAVLGEHDNAATRAVVWWALSCGAASTVFPLGALQFRQLIAMRRVGHGRALGGPGGEMPLAFRTEGICMFVAVVTLVTPLVVALVGT